MSGSRGLPRVLRAGFAPRVCHYAVLLAWVVIGVLSIASGGQVQSHAQLRTGTSSLEGRVTDAQGHPVAMAKVDLVRESGEGSWSAQTDASGKYRIDALAPGAYVLHAKLSGYQLSSFGPFTLAQREEKFINLTLRADKAGTALGAPEFFDQPQFTIAGVTDTTNLGGHASGMAGPSTSLAKEVASLGDKTSVPADDALESSARQKADRNPNDFEANYRAGRVLVDRQNSREGVPYLERASRLKPDDFDSQYTLARAYFESAEYDQARAVIQKLQTTHDTAAVHHLLAEVDEKSGQPLEAVKQYQRAAELDPSETNLFDWGVELLRHRAVDPAIAVFRNGSQRFPQSARMLTALGVAFNERGSYEDAVKSMCAASDIDPRDPQPYLLLGRVQNAEGKSEARLSRLERFAQLDADNPWANYYLALALWKGRRGADDAAISTRVETLLNKVIRLDPKMAEAHLQLGILRADAKDQVAAIDHYKAAITLNSALEQAHYRLAQAYMATGQRELGKQEMEKYKQVSKANADAAEQERKEMRQFVYTMKRPSSEANPN